jgi:hypothetical protein
VLVAVGAGEPLGNSKTSQALAVEPSGFCNCVQPRLAVVNVTDELVKALGFLQEGGGPQVTLAIHPSAKPEKSVLNLKVKHPSALEEENGPGIAVPQKAPANAANGPFPGD